MIPFGVLYACQIVIALVAIGMIAARAHELLWRAPLDARAFADGLRRRMEVDHAAAVTLCKRLRPAYAAELAHAVLVAEPGDQPRGHLIAEQLDDMRSRSLHAIDAIASFGRIASPLALAVAIVELGAGLRGDAGLVALQRGLAESMALGHAILAIVTGMTTSLVCRACATVLTQRSSQVLSGVELIAEALTPATIVSEER